MPRYLITTKCMKNSNGVRIEPGMKVEVTTSYLTNPVITNGGRDVEAAFIRIHGISLLKACALNMVYLDVKQIQ